MGNLSISGGCPRSITCEARFTENRETSGIRPTWWLNGKEVSEEKPRSTEDYNGSALYYLMLPCSISSFGNLTCRVSIEGEKDDVIEAEKSIEVLFPVDAKINMTTTRGATVNESSSASLRCAAEGYPAPKISWTFNGVNLDAQTKTFSITDSKEGTFTVSNIDFKNTGRSDNGTYMCHASNNDREDIKPVTLFIQTKPQVTIDFALGVGMKSIYLNWTLNNGNLPVHSYEIKYLKEHESTWRFNRVRPNATATSFVIDELETNAAYDIEIVAENLLGKSHPHKYSSVKTLSSEADYTPVADVKGSTSNSFTIGWTQPPENIRHLIGHYVSSYKDDQGKENIAIVPAGDGSPVHLFTNLKPATTYFFKVKACHRYTGRCGNFSFPVSGKTIDGKPSPPLNVKMLCDKSGNRYFVTVTWDAPAHPNGHLIHFTVRINMSIDFECISSSPAVVSLIHCFPYHTSINQPLFLLICILKF